MREKGFSDFKQILNTYSFSSPTSKQPKPQTEHGKPLCVLATTDKLTKIGEPQNLGSAQMDQAWVRNVEQFFPRDDVDDKEMKKQAA